MRSIHNEMRLMKISKSYWSFSPLYR